MKILTVAELHAKLKAECTTPIELDGKIMLAGAAYIVLGVTEQTINGMPCLILHQEDQNGETFGVILDRQYADELVKNLGPNPMVEEFFRMH